MKKSDIARSFSLAAPTYDQAAFIQKEIGQRLLQRLTMLKMPFKRILDVGSGTGSLTRALQKQYANSHIVGIDLAPGMIQYAKNKQPRKFWQMHPEYLCADTEFLPFRSHSFDLIFSNFTLQWCQNLALVFSEFKRVLKPGGVILFSSF